MSMSINKTQVADYLNRLDEKETEELIDEIVDEFFEEVSKRKKNRPTEYVSKYKFVEVFAKKKPDTANVSSLKNH